MKHNKNDTDIFARYFIVTMLLCIVAVAILICAFKISLYEGKEWIKLGDKQKRPERVVRPVRGNILSDDDRMMATSTPVYRVYIDFGSEVFKKKGEKLRGGKKAANTGFAVDSLFNSKYNNIDSLAFRLSRKFKDRTKDGYKAYLLKGLKEGKSEFPLYKEKISYNDLKEILTFPLLRLPKRNSFFGTKEMMRRQKPFGMLASRTIGEIYSEIDSSGVTKGRVGLEMQYDSLLRGLPGISVQQRVGGRWADIIADEPVNGIDIRSTIDISIQDLVEKALTDELKKTDADAGTAIIMEVKTGAIKAITNMERRTPGTYSEDLNRAVSDMLEPGSTFKVASMMVAIEDKVAEPTTPVDVGDGNFHYGTRNMTDHNHGRGYGHITAEKAIWYSSNIGVAKIILHGYERNPKKFIDGLHRIGMDADLKLDIPGSAKARLRRPGDKGWSQTSLPWMSFGYEVMIPPIQTLTFFNAIANNGKMMRPMFVTDFLQNGEVVKHFEPETVIPSICSDRTLKIIRNMLYNVVNYKDPTPSRRDGTGKPAKSDIITIAGKTGTAQAVSKSGTYRSGGGHNVSFCGFFPYEDPQYTCFVVIKRPRVGAVSGGGMCGTVVKEIAEKIYAQCTVIDLNKTRNDSLRVSVPAVMDGLYSATTTVTDRLGVKTSGKVNGKFVNVRNGGSNITLTTLPVDNTVVPDVTGMGAKDAVFAMENCGLRVSITGQGVVASQSIPSGSRPEKGKTVLLTLKF
ncbi:MAG: transpeptidase family protein [Tannerella sp.]|jgi:cell division protein FtsI (penicillin-binding protein 3)|nr:transpeptidase family protein [Tannerella sp.]